MEQKWRKATAQKITLNTKLKRLFELLKMLASAASAVLVVLQTVIAKYFTYKREKKHHEGKTWENQTKMKMGREVRLNANSEVLGGTTPVTARLCARSRFNTELV